MEVSVSRSRPKTALVGDVDEHDAVVRKAAPYAAQTLGRVIQVLEDGCEQHHIVLGVSIEASSFLDWGHLYPKPRVGRCESRGHLYASNIPSFLLRTEEELASAATELKHAARASESFGCFSCKSTAGLDFLVRVVKGEVVLWRMRFVRISLRNQERARID